MLSDSLQAFEADFRTYSRSLSSQVAQIYAIDIGTVPSLLLRNELVPLAHFEERLSWSVWLHLHTLLSQWGCDGEEMWIDSARGIICRGPAGPYSVIVGGDLGIGDVPSTVDFLQEDAVVRFFASRKERGVDAMFIGWMVEKDPPSDYVPELVTPNAVEVILTLSDTPIAIAARPNDQNWRDRYNLLERTLLENGLFRFRLGDGRWFKLEWGLDAAGDWLSQAWSIFHTLGITVEDDLEAFVFTRPHVRLEGSLYRSKAKRRRRLQQPIYLFVRPLPPIHFAPNRKRKFKCQTPSLHYWSFRKDGDSPLSHKTCHSLGLPTALRLTCRFRSSSWTTDVYKTIREYQLLRGFDPKTTDFIRHVGYHDIVFQPIIDLAQIEEIHEEQNSGQPSDPHVDFVVYNSDGHTNDSDSGFTTDSDDESSSESDSKVLSNTLEQGQLADLASSSSFQTQDVAEHAFATSLDGGASKQQRISAGYEPRAESVERYDHLDQTPKYLHHKNDATTDKQTVENLAEGVQPIHPLPKRTLFSTDLGHQVYLPTGMEHFLLARPAGRADLSTSQGIHSLLSTSTDLSWADVPFGTPPEMATVSFYPAQPVGSFGMQPEMEKTIYEDAGVEPSSAYAEPSTYSVSCNATASTTGNALEKVGWSRTLQSASFPDANTSLCEAPVFDTDSTTTYPPDSTVHMPVYSTSTVKPAANGYALFTPCYTKGHSAPQQHISPYVPASFSRGQSGPLVGDGNWNCWGDFDFEKEEY
ncbi:hypothetical protein PQX77_000555 [Marasmius sp. AFHP31]|nr:hypothetical protein PQX77_000555 [Marasmius sp. AFHP31]